MLNALRVDIRRYCMTKYFIILVVLATVIQPLLVNFALWLLYKVVDQSMVMTIDNLQSYTSWASIYLAAFVTIFLHAEAGEGIIRNKIISGKKRHHIVFSYCIVNSLLAILVQVLSVIAPLVLGLALGMKFDLQLSELVRFLWVASLSAVAVSVLYTVIYIIFCDYKAAVAIPGIIAVAMYILLTFIVDALYTDSGIPKVSGMTFELYQAFDRFVPFAHLNGALRWDNLSYIIGDGLVIAISLLVGTVFFTKKDLK